ncbi:MAG: D-alanyl-D-alanine-carboxypeptidase/D-alanyl-D-alanine-endopeptidase [Polyangiales bacterium]|jgi:D-alanyl-D-alanine-carboxypeptidase/D-alanyl-D-alanine-endopeptidase
MLAFGCGDTSEPQNDASTRDAMPPDSNIDSGAGELDTGALFAIMNTALPMASNGINGVTLVVHDSDDRRIIEVSVGDFEADRRVPIASASKLVTGLVLLRLIDSGTLSFDDTVGEVLGWTGTPAAGATLDHLGGFVSGMEPESLCLFDPTRTLQACVERLQSAPTVAAPGERFQYGSTHQAVAAAMAEIASGDSWATLFERELKSPLGLTSPELRYYTLPKEGLGDDNPLVAGGMRASADEYMPMLAVLFHNGTHNGERVIREETIQRMGQNGYPGATIDAALEASNLRYSWSSWINCEGAASPCDTITSPGGFGFTPWVDREHGYYAILAMESDGLDGSGFALPLMEILRPEIETLLAE